MKFRNERERYWCATYSTAARINGYSYYALRARAHAFFPRLRTVRVEHFTTQCSISHAAAAVPLRQTSSQRQQHYLALSAILVKLSPRFWLLLVVRHFSNHAFFTSYSLAVCWLWVECVFFLLFSVAHWFNNCENGTFNACSFNFFGDQRKKL